MSFDTRDEQLASRIADLTANDPQFAAAIPSDTVTAAVDVPGLPLPEIVQTLLQGYSERPALGERALEFVADPATGRTTARLLPGSTPSATASSGTGSAPWPRHGTRPVSPPVTGSPSSDSPVPTTP